MQSKQLTYSVEYLENIAFKELEKLTGSSRSRGLDVLAKALLYKDFQSLCESYNINESNKVFDSDLIAENAVIVHDISSGFFFSEFVLGEELGLEYEAAYALKRAIDSYYCSGTGSSHGNIECANLYKLRHSSVKMDKAEETRTVFYFPVRFYCRNGSHSFWLTCGDHYEDVNALWCDDLSCRYPDYFLTYDNFKFYFKKILRILLASHHMIIADTIVRKWEENNSGCYQYLQDNFESHNVYGYGWNGNKRYGLLLPSTRQSLHEKLTRSKRQAPIKGIDELTFTQTYEINLSRNLKCLRKERGITQEELAYDAGISARSISSIESGGGIRFATLKKLAKALHITVESLICQNGG